MDCRRDLEEVVKAFEEAGAALAPIYDVEQLMQDPQVLYRDTITTVDDEDLGPIKMQNVMARLTGTPGTIRFPGRRLGQDNEELYQGSLASVPKNSRNCGPRASS